MNAYCYACGNQFEPDAEFDWDEEGNLCHTSCIDDYDSIEDYPRTD